MKRSSPATRALLGLAGAAAGAVTVGVGASKLRERQRVRHPLLDGELRLIAHRGGAGLAPENTLEAFRHAVHVWCADMIELDVRATADGECVVIHDATVDRTTDGSGPVAEMTLEQVRRLDAGYRHTSDGGETYRFRGRGIRIPTIEEVLEALPGTPLTIEVKAPAAQGPLLRAVRDAGASDRVILGAGDDACRTLFGRHEGPSSASAAQIRRSVVLARLRIGRFWPPPADLLQVPERWDGSEVVSRALVRASHAQGMPVHVWTVDDPAAMHRLLDCGVDGVMTDRPDRLAAVLVQREDREPPPGLATPTSAGMEKPGRPTSRESLGG